MRRIRSPIASGFALGLFLSFCASCTREERPSLANEKVTDWFAKNSAEVFSARSAADSKILREEGELRDAVTTGNELADGEKVPVIYNKPGFGFRIRVDAPARGQALRFGIGARNLKDNGARQKLRFHLNAETDGGGREIWSRTLEAGKDRVSVRGEEMALPELPRGKPLHLIFEVEAPAGGEAKGVWPYWIDPTFLRRAKPVRPQREKINVVVILIDALRADHLECYGYGRETAPAISSLARNGLLFENAFAQAPWTKPSIGTLFTGLYPHRHKALVAVNEPAYREAPQLASLEEEAPPLAETFREMGYATAGFNTNIHLLRAYGFARGFDWWYDLGNLPCRRLNGDIVRWLFLHADRPFFLYIHYMGPHSPYVPTGKYALMWRGVPPGLRDRPLSASDREGLDEAQTPHEGWKNLSDVINAYDGKISETDACVSELKAELRRLGILENTLLVVTSDHGEQLAERDGFGHGWNLFDESIRVPLILSCPRLLGRARRIGEVVEIRNLLAALADAIPAGGGAAEGPLLRKLEREGPGAYSETQVRLSETERKGRARLSCVRSERWKLLRDEGAGRWMLFDLLEDPEEREEVSEQHPEIVAELKEYWNDGTGAFPLEPAAPPLQRPSDLVREQLRALGYIE